MIVKGVVQWRGCEHPVVVKWLRCPKCIIDKLEARLENGRCRFDCRTAKENWTEGYRNAMAGRRAMPISSAEAEEAYREWKRQQESTS